MFNSNPETIYIVGVGVVVALAFAMVWATQQSKKPLPAFLGLALIGMLVGSAGTFAALSALGYKTVAKSEPAVDDAEPPRTPDSDADSKSDPSPIPATPPPMGDPGAGGRGMGPPGGAGPGGGGRGRDGRGGGGRGFGPDQILERRDTNGDGQLDADEINEIPEQFRAGFIEADTNGDGVLSREEIEAMASSFGGRGGSGRPGGGADDGENPARPQRPPM